jgi:hypothetical protein
MQKDVKSSTLCKVYLFTYNGTISTKITIILNQNQINYEPRRSNATTNS